MHLVGVELARPAWGDGIGSPPTAQELTDGLDVELAACAALLGADPTPPAGKAVDRARLEVEIGAEAVPAAGGKPGRIGAAVSLRLAWIGNDDEPALESKVLSQTPIAKGDAKKLPELARAALGRTVGDAVQGLCAKQAVRGGSDDAAIAGLTSQDPEVVILALGVCGERKLVRAYDRIALLLHSNDEDVRDAAIGALVALKDPRGVKALSALAEFKDTDLMRRVIDAIGEIGGDEAHDYLDFVASGHDVPAIQTLAREALERLERREGKKP